jgi:hypothetical protein
MVVSKGTGLTPQQHSGPASHRGRSGGGLVTAFLWGEEGWSQYRHWCQSQLTAAKTPEVIDAAACTFLHEGREPDIRCKYEVGVRQH